MSAPTLALDLQNAAKTYGGPFGRKVRALRSVSMQVRPGEIFGLLGPNGAGKSTLVKILMTVIRPSACRGTLLGHPIGDKRSLRKVGYLPEAHRFPDYLTAEQVLDFYGALADVPRAERRRRSDELLDLVGLTKWKQSPVKGFSKGMKQRLGIANALVNDPDLVVLDEPTDGVDPVGRRDIREILLRLRDQGKTVFLNSHLLSELEMVCERVAIMVQGVVAMQGTLDELTRDSRRYEIEVVPPPDANPPPGFLAADLASVAEISATSGDPATGRLLATGDPVTLAGNTLTIRSDDPALIQPVLDALRARGRAIRAVRPLRASLEDLFMRAVTDPATGRPLDPGAAPATPDAKEHAR